MPKIVIPRGIKPRALCYLAGLEPGNVGKLTLEPADGHQLSGRTVGRYFAAVMGVPKEKRTAMTLAELAAFMNEPASIKAWGDDVWPGRDGEPRETQPEPEPETEPQPEPQPEKPKMTEQKTEKPAAAPATTRGGLDAVIAGIVSGIVAEEIAKRPAIDVDEVRRIAREAAEVTRIEIKTPADREFRKVEGLHHKAMPQLLAWVNLGFPVYMHGPAGSGKSTAGAAVAKALNLPFAMSGKVDSRYELMGFRDSVGRCVRTPFREIWEKGGVFLFDEIDRSDPSAAVALNSGLGGTKEIDFPDATVKMHESTVIIAAGNTLMRGSDRNYVGAAAQDGAVVDRFVFLSWPYDERMERKAVGEDPRAQGWVEFVQMIRRAAGKLKVDVMATPRASIHGAQAILAGVPVDQVAEAVLWKGCDKSTREKLCVESGIDPSANLESIMVRS